MVTQTLAWQEMDRLTQMIHELRKHRKGASHAKRIRLDRERNQLEREMAALVSKLLETKGV